MARHLLTLYTRTPLHVGSGTSVDVVDLPIMRERITGFPVIPSTSLKGVLLQAAREKWGNPRQNDVPEPAKVLFGSVDEEIQDGARKQKSNAGCVQIMEAKLLAFPVRSLAGCFAWLTCPATLERFARDTGKRFDVPEPEKDRAFAGVDLHIPDENENQVVFEEFAFGLMDGAQPAAEALAQALRTACADPLWTALLTRRLAIVHDENFQHFVTTCTEVVTRIKVDPATRTAAGTALFNQENVPCETLFYSVLTVLAPRRDGAADGFDAGKRLAELLPTANGCLPILQIGGDETTGHGLCEVKREELP
jgi:CRISPR-associated protein Cmr4